MEKVSEINIYRGYGIMDLNDLIIGRTRLYTNISLAKALVDQLNIYSAPPPPSEL